MWEKIFPAQTPVEGLDYDRLARLNLTGGNIHSIALNAAFMAAQADATVNMPIVLAAARTEIANWTSRSTKRTFECIGRVRCRTQDRISICISNV